MAQADISTSLMKPMVMAAMRLAGKGKGADNTKKKAEVKSKMKMSVKVKRG